MSIVDDQAIEAAARVLSKPGVTPWNHLSEQQRQHYRDQARPVLIAAARYMGTAARRSGFRVLLDQVRREIVKHDTPGRPGRVSAMVLGLQRAERMVTDALIATGGKPDET